MRGEIGWCLPISWHTQSMRRLRKNPLSRLTDQISPKSGEFFHWGLSGSPTVWSTMGHWPRGNPSCMLHNEFAGADLWSVGAGLNVQGNWYGSMINKECPTWTPWIEQSITVLRLSRLPCVVIWEWYLLSERTTQTSSSVRRDSPPKLEESTQHFQCNSCWCG